MTQKRLIVSETDENLDLRGLCSMHVGIFNLDHVKVIWGHLVHFSKNWVVTQKRLIVERSEQKFGPWECMYHAC